MMETVSHSTDILNVTERDVHDESIVALESYPFSPIVGTNLNTPGQITIRIENLDAFFYPRKSWIEIEGSIKKVDGSEYTATDKITLANNAIMHLFDNIRYELGGQVIESLYNPGQCSTILGLAKYNCNTKSKGMNFCWLPDTDTTIENAGWTARHAWTSTADKVGDFRFSIDLDHIFGFAEDYDKVIFGLSHSLTLVNKGNSEDALVKATAAPKGSIILSKVRWFMPKVTPNLDVRNHFITLMEKDQELDCSFRQRQCLSVSIPTAIQKFTWRLGVRTGIERPRYIFICFQTARSGNQDKNASIFDDLDVRNMYVLLNEVRFPAIDFYSSFKAHRFDHVYKNFVEFSQKYYGFDSLISAPDITPSQFKDMYSIFVFDASKQEDRLIHSVVDMRVEIQFATPLLASTTAFAVVLSDRKLKLKIAGKKMAVAY